mmetsp:Transcript_12774/g.21586  ORF Transcript_12774/g.21586 Transcript_12774/m.21586 type:complete len:331 (-) Transcript_12774:1912-2904(-)
MTHDDYNMDLQDEVLIIQKSQVRMSTRAKRREDSAGGIQYPNYGIVGIMNIKMHIFLIVITERKHAAKMVQKKDNVYLITGVEFIPFDRDLADYRELPAEIVRYVEGIKQLLEQQGFYYSYYADITSNLQRQAEIYEQKLSESGQSSIIHQNLDLFWLRDCQLDKRYQWNERITHDFTYNNIHPFWTVPIVQGYIEQARATFDRRPIEVMLISRRRYQMAGARFISRGIDDNSNVANFVESELILTYERHSYSFVQVRGSIPLFWEQKQKGLNSKISLKRSEHLTKKAFVGHFDDMKRQYKRIVMINLVKEHNLGERALTERLVSMLKQS